MIDGCEECGVLGDALWDLRWRGSQRAGREGARAHGREGGAGACRSAAASRAWMAGGDAARADRAAGSQAGDSGADRCREEGEWGAAVVGARARADGSARYVDGVRGVEEAVACGGRWAEV